MAPRRALVLLSAVGLVLASCGGDSSGSGSATGSIGSPTSEAGGSSVATDGPSTATGEPDGADFDVIVSAAVDGSGVSSVDVEDLVVHGGAGPGEPWLTFDLGLSYSGGETNTVVFDRGSWSAPAGAPAQLRIDGPTCGGNVSCDDDVRRVALAPHAGALVGFEVFRDGDDLSPVEPGTLAAELDAVFDYEHPNLADEPMVVSLRFDVGEPTPGPTGTTTPIATGQALVATVGGGFDLLEFPFAAVADDAEQLASVLAPSREPVEVDELPIAWPAQAAVVLTIPTNSCAPLLADVDVVDGTARPVFVNAGYRGCEDLLASHTVIAAVDRSVLVDADELVLPAEDLYFEEPVVSPVDVSPPDREPAPTRPDVEFGDVRGTAELPARGEADTATLDDGTPVFVVHHHDSTISVLDPRAGTDDPGRLQVLHWDATSRHFLGRGAWDEYGRRADGFRTTDLLGFATRVVDRTVEIGALVDPPAGSPTARSTDPPAMAATSIAPSDVLGLDQALALPEGRTAWIDASVIVDPDGGHICAGRGSDDPFPIEPCPARSPTADGIAATPGSRTIWFGPLLATRTSTGFERVAPTSGIAGNAL